MFCMFGKDGNFFIQIWYYPSVKKSKWSSPWKYISGIIERDDIHPRKHGTFSDRKDKDDKKVYSVKHA